MKCMHACVFIWCQSISPSVVLWREWWWLDHSMAKTEEYNDIELRNGLDHERLNHDYWLLNLDRLMIIIYGMIPLIFYRFPPFKLPNNWWANVPWSADFDWFGFEWSMVRRVALSDYDRYCKIKILSSLRSKRYDKRDQGESIASQFEEVECGGGESCFCFSVCVNRPFRGFPRLHQLVESYHSHFLCLCVLDLSFRPAWIWIKTWWTWFLQL